MSRQAVALILRAPASLPLRRKCGVLLSSPRTYSSLRHQGMPRQLHTQRLSIAGVGMRCFSSEGTELNKEYFYTALTSSGKDPIVMKRAYLKLARANHPDANPEDKDAAAKFVLLGKTYELILKNLAEGTSNDGANDLEDHEDDEDEEYGEDEARSTYSGAGGPLLTREMRRELKRVTEEMSAGGVRDGGMFLMAQMYGGNDGVKDLPGGPNLNQGEMQALPDGRKPRRRKK